MLLHRRDTAIGQASVVSPRSLYSWGLVIDYNVYIWHVKRSLHDQSAAWKRPEKSGDLVLLGYVFPLLIGSLVCSLLKPVFFSRNLWGLTPTLVDCAYPVSTISPDPFFCFFFQKFIYIFTSLALLDYVSRPHEIEFVRRHSMSQISLPNARISFKC